MYLQKSTKPCTFQAIRGRFYSAIFNVAGGFRARSLREPLARQGDDPRHLI
jgi:hypothetical protein